ncbi:hypothetical protein NGTWS1702_01760 [Mycolicibacterium cyprinidarum]|uniref:Uncharacterized protein n=1 Tax=Mycolicibacterium cyprinidarum TaxID=2860311 RepID=A0ABQ4V824_9MYCO|nr:hypothetical protein NGTWS1702_01760 [Mycolicibacterium sp. NGTWSNA01]
MLPAHLHRLRQLADTLNDTARQGTAYLLRGYDARALDIGFQQHQRPHVLNELLIVRSISDQLLKASY